MINAVLVFNNVGQPRLTKFYSQLETNVQQTLISEIFELVSQRGPKACNFLPLPALLQPKQDASTLSPAARARLAIDAPSLVTYRNYATLFFIIISTSTESPLALLDFIQVFVEALDRFFPNVCELDLIFNFETLHVVLAEMIIGGIVIETDLNTIVKGVRAQGINPKRKESAASGLAKGLSLGLGTAGWGGWSARR